MQFRHEMTQLAFRETKAAHYRMPPSVDANYSFTELLSDRPGFMFKRRLSDRTFGAVGIRFKDSGEPSQGKTSVRICFFERTGLNFQPCKILRSSEDILLGSCRKLEKILELFLKTEDSTIAQNPDGFCKSLVAVAEDIVLC